MKQSEALAILKTGRNVFLTGEPGAGKSHTIREYVEYLRSHGIDPAITASTGIASTHIGGMTIHSWSGVGIKKHLSTHELREIKNRERLAKRIRETHVLIIDEISMIDGNMLRIVDTVCRAVKENDEPFGGMQVIFVGDFFQLPPVSRNGEPVPQFAFMSDTWVQANPTICYLTEQHRQEDEAFLSVLSAMRKGQVLDEHKALLLERGSRSGGAVEPDITKLFSHNLDVDQMNALKLRNIPGEVHVYKMTSQGSSAVVEPLKRGCLSPEELALKKGARVMFTKNSPEGQFVNGSTGEVTGFADSGFPIVKLRTGRIIEAVPMEWKVEAEGKVLGTIVQVPLRLAWAITVHKSQGMSLDQAHIDLSRAFAYGQGYVALSRVRTLDGVYLSGLNERALEVDPLVLKVDERFCELSSDACGMLEGLTKEDLGRAHEKFILMCGGTLAAQKREPKVVETVAVKKQKRLEQTLALIVSGMTVEEAAALRGRSSKTILKHLEDLRAFGPLPTNDMRHIFPGKDSDLQTIRAAFAKYGVEKLKPVFEALDGRYDYEVIQIGRLFA